MAARGQGAIVNVSTMVAVRGPTRTPGAASVGDMNDTLAAASPLRRVNEPGDVAEAIRYLLSDTAVAITGAVLPVDGGRVAAL
jgi:NAD(P)-dependent dehydrogenase (short-subunit alcohol dehydrogenase family)